MKTLTIVLLVLLSCSHGGFAELIDDHRVCYFFFGDVDDLGWTFRFNEGRLEFHRYARQELGYNIHSFVEKNVFFRSSFGSDLNVLADILAANVNERGCHIIVANNRVLFGDEVKAALKYPSVFLVVVNDELVHKNVDESLVPKNLLYIGVRSDKAFYVAGSAAGTYAKRCIGFIAAFDTAKNSFDAANGFSLGASKVAIGTPVHIFPMQQWSWPQQEVLVARFITDTLGCDIIARYTDSQEVDALIASNVSNAHDHPVLTIGIHSELNRYVGDSVLLSVYNNWLDPLKDALVPLLQNNRTQFNKTSPQQYLYNPVVSELSSTSTLPKGIFSAVQTAENYVSTRDSIFCGTLRTRTREFTHKGTPPNNCFAYHEGLDNIALFPNVVLHNHWVDSNACPTGTYFNYGKQPGSGSSFQGVCKTCPPATFSDKPGMDHCTPCPEGTTSIGNATVCVIEQIEEESASRVVIYVLAAILAAIAVILLIVGGVYIRKMRKKVKHAPVSLPLTLVSVRIDQLSIFYQTHPQSMEKAMRQFNDILLRDVNDGNGYIAQSLPEDVILVAFHSVSDAALFCITLNKSLHRADWPSQLRAATPELQELYNGLIVCCSILHCTAGVDCRFNSLQQSYSYHGSQLHVLERLNCVAPPGHTIINNETLNALKESPHFVPLVQSSTTIAPLAVPEKSFGFSDATHSAETSRSREERHSMKLFTILPVELSRRNFDEVLQQEPAATREGETIQVGHNVHVSSELVLRVLDMLFSRHPADVDRKRLFASMCKAWDVRAESSDSLRIKMIKLSEVVSRAILQKGMYQDADTVSASHSSIHTQSGDGGGRSLASADGGYPSTTVVPAAEGESTPLS